MIEALRDQFSIHLLCQTLNASRSGYYQWLQNSPTERQLENQRLTHEMQTIHRDKFLRSYGSPRMTEELNQRGFACSENRVARLMRQADLRASSRRPFRPCTTQADEQAHPAPNLLKERSHPKRPGEVLVGDITYVATREGWLYLAVVMDLFSRMIIGWHLSSSLATPLVSKALEKGLRRLRPEDGAIFHSDRGCQYSSAEFRAALAQARLTQSMSRKANCYDNAVCESAFATLKGEGFPEGCLFDSKAEARREIFEYLESFYNTRRLHSSLGYVPPLTFLTRSLNQTNLNLN